MKPSEAVFTLLAILVIIWIYFFAIPNYVKRHENTPSNSDRPRTWHV